MALTGSSNLFYLSEVPPPPGGQTNYWPLRTDLVDVIGSLQEDMFEIFPQGIDYNEFITTDPTYGDVYYFGDRGGNPDFRKGYTRITSNALNMTSGQFNTLAWSIKLQFKVINNTEDGGIYNQYSTIFNPVFTMDLDNQEAKLGNINSGVGSMTDFAFSWSQGEWITVVITSAANNTDAKLYLGKDSTGTLSLLGSATLTARIDQLSRGNFGDGFQGYAKDCRWWRGTELTAAQAQQAMSADLS